MPKPYGALTNYLLEACTALREQVNQDELLNVDLS